MNLADDFVRALEENSAAELTELARRTSAEPEDREAMTAGLLEIAASGLSHRSRLALNGIAYLRLGKSQAVQRSLRQILSSIFPKDRLEELAFIEAAPGERRSSGVPGELRHLTDFVLLLLRYDNEGSRKCVEELAEIFKGTGFGAKILEWLENPRPTGNDLPQGE